MLFFSERTAAAIVERVLSISSVSGVNIFVISDIRDANSFLHDGAKPGCTNMTRRLQGKTMIASALHYLVQYSVLVLDERGLRLVAVWLVSATAACVVVVSVDGLLLRPV